MDEASSAFAQLLPSELVDTFKSKFNNFTTVQIKAGKELLSLNDVVVESPTGSGKTLAFVLPSLVLMKKRAKFGANEVGCLVLSPSRELAVQIASVATPFAESLGYSVALAIGGTNVDASRKKILTGGANVLIATPGRLFQLLTADKDGSFRRIFKTVEVFVVDEADRFNESQFEVHLKEILSALPKQRRTALFSATQAKEREDLVAFGLRNAKHIKLKESTNVVSPAKLSNHYVACASSERLMCLIEFIRSKPAEKILVFLPSCRVVQYFQMIMPRVLTKRDIFAVHGKSGLHSRTTQIEEFRKSENGVMFSTDVMSRGIDINDISWVVQFEIPKLSSWFVHRSGRTARCGREGSALLILGEEQKAYVQFVSKHEQVELTPLKVTTCTAAKAEQLREKLIKIQTQDREILEAGTRAFVSHLESYVKHDCSVVCGLKELNVCGLAHSYALLRLPKMRELSGRTDIEAFKRSDIDTSTIAYAKPALEQNRKQVMKQKHEKKVQVLKERASAEKAKQLKLKNREAKKTADVSRKRKADSSEKGGLEEDMKLMKKIKKGRLSAKEVKNMR